MADFERIQATLENLSSTRNLTLEAVMGAFNDLSADIKDMGVPVDNLPIHDPDQLMDTLSPACLLFLGLFRKREKEIAAIDPDQRLEHLSQRLQNRTNLFCEKQRQYEASLRHLEILRRELEQKEQKLETLTAQTLPILELQAQCASLQEQIDTLRALSLPAAQQEHKQLKETWQIKKTLLDDLQQETEALTGTLGEMEAKEQELEALRQKLTVLTSEKQPVMTLQAQCALLQEDIAKLEALSLPEAQEALEKTRELHRQRQESLNTLKQEAARLTLEVEKKQQEERSQQEINGKIKEMRSAVELNIGALNSERIYLLQKKDDAERAEKELTQKRNDAMSKIDALFSGNQALESEIKALEARYDTLAGSSAKKRLDSMKTRVQRFNDLCHALQKDGSILTPMHGLGTEEKVNQLIALMNGKMAALEAGLSDYKDTYRKIQNLFESYDI